MNRLWLAIVKHEGIGTLPMLFKTEKEPTTRIIKARITPNLWRQRGIAVLAVYDLTALMLLDTKSAEALKTYIKELV